MVAFALAILGTIPTGPNHDVRIESPLMLSCYGCMFEVTLELGYVMGVHVRRRSD
jgi:hypothetical protein